MASFLSLDCMYKLSIFSGLCQWLDHELRDGFVPGLSDTLMMNHMLIDHLCKPESSSLRKVKYMIRSARHIKIHIKCRADADDKRVNMRPIFCEKAMTKLWTYVAYALTGCNLRTFSFVTEIELPNECYPAQLTQLVKIMNNRRKKKVMVEEMTIQVLVPDLKAANANDVTFEGWRTWIDLSGFFDSDTLKALDLDIASFGYNCHDDEIAMLQSFPSSITTLRLVFHWEPFEHSDEDFVQKFASDPKWLPRLEKCTLLRYAGMPNHWVIDVMKEFGKHRPCFNQQNTIAV